MAGNFEEIEQLTKTITSLEERIRVLEHNRVNESCFSHLNHLALMVIVKPFAGMIKVFGYAIVFDMMNCAMGMIAASAQPTAQPCLMLKTGWEVCPAPRSYGAHTRTDSGTRL